MEVSPRHFPLTYYRAVKHLYEQLPMFQRVGASAYKKDLTNMLALCEMLDNPHTRIKTIHVAGTNGKGSVSHLIASMLMAAGYKTGLYISPHYRDFRERIKIDGKYIKKKEVTGFVEKYYQRYLEIKPSFFELTAAMAFDCFARNKVDVAVIETGMGGRLDSTNVITPVISVITNIGLDHTQFLGDTLELIAYEKAGIIKPGVPVVIGETNEATAPVFIQKARECESPISFADQKVRVALKSKSPSGMQIDIFEKERLVSENLHTDLYGNFQLKNIATAWWAVKKIPKTEFAVSEQDMLRGLMLPKLRTRMIGRWHFMQSKDPMIVCDSAHNEHGLKVSLPELNDLKYENLHIVLGTVNDKDLSHMLPLFPKNARYYFCKPDIPRGLDACELQRQAARYGLVGEVYPSVPHALYQGAKRNAKNEDLIFIGGSTYVVAEVVF